MSVPTIVNAAIQTTITVIALIATVTYDGLSASALWKRQDVVASERLIDLGFSDFWAGVTIGSFGLVGSLVVVVLLWETCSGLSARMASWSRTSNGRIAEAFVHSLIPVALAYFVARFPGPHVSMNPVIGVPKSARITY
jgi:hypothetical protein